MHDASDVMFRRTASLHLHFVSCVMTTQNATILGGCHPGWAVTVTPKFDLGLVFCTMHLPPSFIILSFTRSDVIMLTNPQTNRRRRKHPTFFATLRRWVKRNNNCQSHCTQITKEHLITTRARMLYKHAVFQSSVCC